MVKLTGFSSLITVLALISCDKDAVSENTQTVQGFKSNGNESIIVASDTSDAFEVKGKLFYNLTTAYTEKYGYPNSVQELTGQILFISENWGNDSQEWGSRLITSQYIRSIMQNPKDVLAEILENAAISKEVKTKLTQLNQDLIDLSHQEYQAISNFINSYQEKVKQNEQLTAEDKKVIVTVAVISNYALYAESVRKDRDWETSVANKQAPLFFTRNQTTLITLIALMDRFIK